MTLFIEKKYQQDEDTNLLEHPIVVAERNELKKISEKLNIVSASFFEHMPSKITTKIEVKGNKELINKLVRLGWTLERREKVEPNNWNNVKTPYFVQFMVKEIIYCKWAIFRGSYGLFAIEYLDNLYEVKKKYPYIREDALPVLVNASGGYTSFSKDYNGNEFIKIIKICEDDEPLTREERYPKNSDKFHYGWISPNGDTYTCGFESHIDCAYAICDELFPNEYIGNAEYHLEELGWIKISRPVPYNYENLNKQAVYFTSLTRKLTKKQINTLVALNLQDDPYIAWRIKCDE